MTMSNSWIGSEGRANVVSIIIPTYNRRMLLIEALQSVVEQTYRPLECVVIDDGSTDDTADKMRQWQSENSSPSLEFKYIRQANSGAPAARNHGTRQSTGEFIQYLDSDDLLYPEKITLQARELQTRPTIDGVFGDWEMGLPEDKKLVLAYKEDDLVAQFLGFRCIHTLSFLLRRSIVKRIGCWDEALKRNQEIDFHLRGALVGGHFVYQQLNCGLWRLHPEERISARPGTSDLYAFYRKWAQVLEEANELTPSRRRAISDALFHSATSPNADEPSVLLDMLTLSRRLFPERAEFKTSKMRAMSSIMGENFALRAWLWRAKQSRPASPQN